MTAEEPGQSTRFEKALLISYLEAAKADPSSAVGDPSGIFSHVLIEPADSPFATWLIERRIAVVTAGGEVALPYGGSHLQISVLAHALIIHVRELAATVITGGEEPPVAHWQALEELRERYNLPAMVHPGPGLPEQLLA